jgi:hypothetical protein
MMVVLVAAEEALVVEDASCCRWRTNRRYEMRAPADEVGVGRHLGLLAALGSMRWTGRGVGTTKQGSSSSSS